MKRSPVLFSRNAAVAALLLVWIPIAAGWIHGLAPQTRTPIGAGPYLSHSMTLRSTPTVEDGDSRYGDSQDWTPPPVAPVSDYLATCIPGLAPMLADELADIHPGISEITMSGNAAVTFQATREASLYALCWVRIAHRLLERVAVSEEGSLYDRQDLHSFITKEDDGSGRVHVKDLLGDGKGGLLTLSVKAILNNPRQLPQDLSHSHFTALTVKNALCDAVRGLRGDRPSVDLEAPDVPLVVLLHGREGAATASLYRSLHPPGSLHKRGYRRGAAIHKAAMKESLAAGLLRQAEWQTRVATAKQDKEIDDDNSDKVRLVDPMAGSGSFVLEASMIAADIAPGLMRIRCGVPDHQLPPVTRWKSDTPNSAADTAELWKSILTEAKERAKNGMRWMRQHPDRIQIMANDIHPGAVAMMEQSLETAGLLPLVTTTTMDCYDLAVPTEEASIPHLIVTNPPWGIRLTEDVEDSWEGLRHYIRDACPKSNTQAWILSGDKSSTKLLKLRRDRMIPIQTGDQTLRWIQYTIRGPAGSRGEPEALSSTSSSSSSQESTSVGAAARETVPHDDAW